jgi:hypothetical protein
MSSNAFSVTLPSSWYTSKGIGELEKRAIFFEVLYLLVTYPKPTDSSLSRGFYLGLSPNILRKASIIKMNFARWISQYAVLKMTGNL